MHFVLCKGNCRTNGYYGNVLICCIAQIMHTLEEVEKVQTCTKVLHKHYLLKALPCGAAIVHQDDIIVCSH